MALDLNDTIAAIASAAGGAVRGVVRISGPKALDVAQGIAGEAFATSGRLPVAVRSAVQLSTERSIPATYLVWPGKKSYTREPTVEIHTLGSPPLLNLVLDLACQHGARLAQPGEFTLRAFLAGRMDLTQAEAVLGVIDAVSDRALQNALRQLAGGLAEPLGAAREELLVLLADLEAGLDFADEDIAFVSRDVLANRLSEVHCQLDKLAKQIATRSTASELPKVVVVGPTNAGKSSLFNALVGRFGTDVYQPSAIESPEPGATRDYLTATVDFHGARCELVDTAGTEDVGREDSPRAAAQSVTRSVRREASLVLLCHDATLHPLRETPSAKAALTVLTKADALADKASKCLPAIVTSAHSGAGLDDLSAEVAERLAMRRDEVAVASTAERSRESLRTSLDALGTASALAEKGESEELVAAELRLALDELGQIAGVVYTDDVLDRVFSRFCIGK